MWKRGWDLGETKEEQEKKGEGRRLLMTAMLGTVAIRSSTAITPIGTYDHFLTAIILLFLFFSHTAAWLLFLLLLSLRV